jgi:acetyltransferase-like isoleucine patch superfamily enzyme
MRNLIRKIFVFIKFVLFIIYNKICYISVLLKLFLFNIPHGKIHTGGGILRLRISSNGSLIIGNHVNFANYWEVGWNSKCYIRISSRGKVVIGDYVGINSSAIFCDESIMIGNHVHIGGGTQIFDTNFHNLDYLSRRNPALNNVSKTAPVIIEDDVFIGSSCIIGKGVTIGARSIVAAGSVVIKSIPSDEIWGGNPAKFIKKINTVYEN